MCTLTVGAGDGFSFVAADLGLYQIERGEVVGRIVRREQLVGTARGFAATTGDGRFSVAALSETEGEDVTNVEAVQARLERVRASVRSQPHDPEQLAVSTLLAAVPGGIIRYDPEEGVEQHGPGGCWWYCPPGFPKARRDNLRRRFGARVDTSDPSSVLPAVQECFAIAHEHGVQACPRFAVGMNLRTSNGWTRRRFEGQLPDRILEVEDATAA